MTAQDNNDDFDYMGKPELPPTPEEITKQTLDSIGVINRSKRMSKERYKELMDNPMLELTQEEWDMGYHFCYEWDFLLIHKDDPESESCSCFSKDRDDV